MNEFKKESRGEMNPLIEVYNGNTIQMLVHYIQQYIDRNSQSVWEKLLPETEGIFARAGDSAYGFFCLKLFEPLMKEIVAAGFVSHPVLPGAFPQSVEHWGPWEDRERRFWSVIHQENGLPIGTLVFRIYHDHTRLRLPRTPQVYAIPETDPSLISKIVEMDDPAGKSEMEGVRDHED